MRTANLITDIIGSQSWVSCYDALIMVKQPPSISLRIRSAEATSRARRLLGELDAEDQRQCRLIRKTHSPSQMADDGTPADRIDDDALTPLEKGLSEAIGSVLASERKYFHGYIDG